MTPETVELGSVIGVFGFKGEVRVHLHNPESDFLHTTRAIVLVHPDGTRVTTTLRVRPGAGKRIIGSLGTVADEAGAKALQGATILVAKADLPALEDDEFYVWQLEGAEVHINGQRRGTVAVVHSAGEGADAPDLFEVACDDGRAVFVPVIHAFVVRVDPVGRVVHLHEDALEED